MNKETTLCVLEYWEGVRGWFMPERRRIEFWIRVGQEFRYKLVVVFEDILEAVGYPLDGDKVNAVVLKLRYGPKIYQKISGPGIASKFSTNRYFYCKEDFDFLWVRTTDISATKSIGQSTSFCWEIGEGLEASDTFRNFPYYQEDMNRLDLEDGEEFCSASETVPLIRCGSDKLAYEVLFQLNSLVHTQKN